jgi:hypothetical protein
MSGARTRITGNRRFIALWNRIKPLFSVPIWCEKTTLNVCERETVGGGKSLHDLVELKVGESPTNGDAGKLHNVCWRGWQATLGKYQHRYHWQAPGDYRGSLG